jgi:hypothetical protein
MENLGTILAARKNVKYVALFSYILISFNQAQLNFTEKKSLRRSTAVKSEAAEIRKKVRDERTKMMKEIAARKNVPEVRRLTQEDLLAESKITEKLNQQSLGQFTGSRRG